MDLLNLCMKIPNLGILIFYLIFVIIIPYMLMASNSNDILKYYMPLLIAFANLLTLSGDKRVFGNLYQLQPDNFVAFISTNFINLFALFGILWQCLEHSKKYNIDVTLSVLYGAILFIIAFPMARQGMAFILTHVDKYMRKTTDLKYNYNWHLITFGLLYIVFLLGLQAILLSLIDYKDKDLSSQNKLNILKNINKNQPNNKVAQKIENVNNEPSNNNVEKVQNDTQNSNNNKKINKILNDILKSLSNDNTNNKNQNNPTKNIIDQVSLSNVRNVINTDVGTSKSSKSSSKTSTTRKTTTTKSRKTTVS